MRKGQRTPDEVRHKQSLSQKGRPLSVEHRAALSKAALRRAPMSTITRQKISAFQKSFVKTESHLKKIYAALRESRPERTVREFLKLLPIEFLHQYRVPGINSPFDFAVPESKILIEVDGCYWHGCPLHYQREYHPQRLRDAAKEDKASSEGWKVIRIWEHDISSGLSDDLLVRSLFHG